jgi:hypothetical protein
LLSNVNKRHAVLEILRDAGPPLSTAEGAARFAGRLGLDEGYPRLGQIANRLSRRSTASLMPTVFGMPGSLTAVAFSGRSRRVFLLSSL